MGRKKREGGGKKEDCVEAVEKAAAHRGQSGLDGEPACPPGPEAQDCPQTLRLPSAPSPTQACVLVDYLLFNRVNRVWDRLSPAGRR